MRRQAVRWLLVLLWMGLIFCISAQPDLPHHPEHLTDLIMRKLAHMAEYGILAGLVWRAWPRSGERDLQCVLLYALIFSSLYAISDEVHQVFVPGRTARLLDVGFDSLGALLALLLIYTLVGRRQPQQVR
jgi:VanZ family protein